MKAQLSREPIGFRCRRNDGLGDWSYVYHREPDDFERKHLVIERIFAETPAPVAIPDDLLHMAADAIEDLLKNGNRDSLAAAWYDLPGKLRAAIQAEPGTLINEGTKPVSQRYTLPDGWQLVPVEPTEKMVIEGFESEPDEFFSDEDEWKKYQDMSGCEQAAHRAKLCWSAMLAAVPAAPEQEV